jgi:hypothetical protein
VIYLTLAGRAVDTDQELSPPERHVLQKLMAWQQLGLPLADYASRRAKALQQGWDGRGPVTESPALRAVADDLAARLAVQHGQRPGPGWLKAQAWPGSYAGGGLEAGQWREGRLEIVVRDAADVPRGRLWLDTPPGQAPRQALELALAELVQGGGDLARQLADLGLGPRA